MGNPWDEFSAGGDYVEFNNIGDSVTGTITAITAKRWDDGKVSPQLALRLDDGQETTLTAGWVLLVKELKAKAPNVGDRIKVTMTGKGPKPKETREWSVEILGAAKAQEVPTPAPASAAAPSGGADPLANLTAEQRAALGLPPAQATAPAVETWDTDPRVAPLRAAGVADEVIKATLGL